MLQDYNQKGQEGAAAVLTDKQNMVFLAKTFGVWCKSTAVMISMKKR